MGRLKESQQVTDGNTYTSKYTYNLSGALVEQEYPSGRTVKSEFDDNADLARITGKTNSSATEHTYATAFSYFADGKIEKLRLGNGLWESAKLNTRLQVTELAMGHSVGEGSLMKINYDYGALQTNGTVDATKNDGNIGKQTVNFSGLANPFIQTYKYDSLDRITEAIEKVNGTQSWKQTFDYDRYGNRTSFYQIVGSQELTMNNLTLPTVDSATNRFAGSQGYSYDKNGNVVADAASSGRTFIFNGDNKQTEVKDSGNVTIGTYYYDGNGKRVKKVTDLETTIFVYDGMGKLVAEYSNATPPTDPTINYTATDQLGSPRVITDAFGEVVARRDFMPFGEELYADGTYRKTSDVYSTSGEDAVRQRFIGYQKDIETGLDFAEARMYQNQHGRFTAVDPLLASGKSADPQTFNRYLYVMNSPVVLSDPTGLQAGKSDLKPCSSDCEGTLPDENNAVHGTSRPMISETVEGTDSTAPGSLSSWAVRDIQKSGLLPLGCPADLPCGNSNASGPSLDIASGESSRTVEGIARISETASLVPGFGAPFGLIAGFTRAGQGDASGAGLNFLGAIPSFAALSKLSSGVSALRTGGQSFSAYRASRGASEILGTVDVMTRGGRQIPYAIRTELSHMFVSQATQRQYNLPNWLVNNRINVWRLNTIQHALVDSNRFRTLPIGLKPQVGWTNSRFSFFTRNFK